jgi:hypothetical protein
MKRYLIVMRVGDESCANSEKSKRFDFEMGRPVRDVGLVQRNQTVVLLIDVLQNNNHFMNKKILAKTSRHVMHKIRSLLYFNL